MSSFVKRAKHESRLTAARLLFICKSRVTRTQRCEEGRWSPREGSVSGPREVLTAPRCRAIPSIPDFLGHVAPLRRRRGPPGVPPLRPGVPQAVSATHTLLRPEMRCPACSFLPNSRQGGLQLTEMGSLGLRHRPTPAAPIRATGFVLGPGPPS